jgi:hypothetical protein
VVYSPRLAPLSRKQQTLTQVLHVQTSMQELWC